MKFSDVDPASRAEFVRYRAHDGYLPISAHGLLGDGSTAALIGCDGSLAWLCVPRFDSEALFCPLLDFERGGQFRIEPEQIREWRQYYLDDSGVLVTELRAEGGILRIVDALVLNDNSDLKPGEAAAAHALVRSAWVVEGEVRVRVTIEPRGGGELHRTKHGWCYAARRQPNLALHFDSNRPLQGGVSEHLLRRGDYWDIVLDWNRKPVVLAEAVERLLNATCQTWRRWAEHVHYDGPQAELVRRSAITLKMLDYTANGAIVAAPTSSLPEAIGGIRNWDYRYAWIRDAAFSVYALRRIGLEQEAWMFLSWVLKDVEQEDRPRVLYNLDGQTPQAEYEDDELRGYRNSAPVRWGNAAAGQLQHDVLGEVIDCAYQWVAGGADLPEHLWQRLTQLVDLAADEWRKPDHGIWEVRSPTKVFTYSAAMCHVALDRAIKLSERLGLPGDTERWQRGAAEIREAILEQAWCDERQAITSELGDKALDASVLTLPLRRVVPATHPKMVATTRAIVEHLGAGDGLLYRYRTDEFPDGLTGKEGAFVLCSFWLVDNLALQGHLDEAQALFDSLCQRANHLGLLPEQIDPSTGLFLGNFPQAFSHVGVIASGVTLGRLLRHGLPEPQSG